MRLLFGLLFVLSGLMACQTKNDIATSVGSLELQFDNRLGNSDLVLGVGLYRNRLNETFTVTRFDYFVSNIRLLRADGSAYTVPQDDSYFLVREADPASQVIKLSNVPAGDYTQLEFMVGVDSLRNTADISKRTGILDPAGSHTSGMYWDWNSGYIHLKMEGTSPQAPLDATGNRNFRYHIGLFGGYQARTLNNTRVVRVPISVNGAGLRTSPDLKSSLVISTDAAKLFDGPTPISIATYPDVMVSPVSAIIANNYATMFSLKSSGTNSK